MKKRSIYVLLAVSYGLLVMVDGFSAKSFVVHGVLFSIIAFGISRTDFPKKK
jgi:hypothetical protein